jgi:hypothetical protein
VCEQGGPSEGIPVVNLSSTEEEDALLDTSRDEEFTRRLFGDLNRRVLGPPGDGNVIVLSDSDEEEEVHEEITTNTEAAPPSAVNSSTQIISVAAADDSLDGVQHDSSDGGDEAGSP